MATPFTVYSGADNTALTNALLAPGSGITIAPGSIVLKASGQDAVNFYDGSLAPLGIGAGLLLTSGTTPGTVNTVGWFGTDNSGTSGFLNGDANIDAVVNTVFQTQSYDATTLSFDFTVADPAATSVSFDVVFGSDEFPEWVDQFVDSAIVMVNGVNYALFNHDPLHPLSVVSANLAAGYFQDNAGNVLPIEYDGVSHVLKIVAPIIPGASNHIKIGIADTGDHIYDSGVFLANFTAGNIPGSGVIIVPPISGTDNSDNLTGTLKDEYFDLKAGDDTCYAGAGDDIVVAGSGNDSVFGGSGADQLKGDAGDDNLDGGIGNDTAVYAGPSTDYSVAVVSGGFTITDSKTGPASEGTDTLTNIELAKFSNGLFAIGAGGVLTPVTDPGTPPANTPGSVAISGIGSAGKTLTAVVSDPDGVAGAVSYQWQVSSDNGATWSNVGTDSNAYTVANGDVGKAIQVVASYVDNGAQAESPVSTAKTILAAKEGDLLVTLIQLDAPVGASTINPLTTLVQDAIEFGLSPNTAALAIKTVFGLPAAVNLVTYDAYAVLQATPTDPTALAVEKVAVEVAILTSLSDDDKGTNLTLKILDAAANNQTLDLANANDLANILGLDTTTFDINDKKTYPQPLREIFDRNDNIAQAGNVGGIETEWQDFLSIQDNVNSTSIADLSIHVNQAPTGVATANLADGLENAAYIVNASDLLQGFSDPEGNALSVSGLSADNGSVTDNGDGTFTITPPPNYSGPVELTYTVNDGLGGATGANQLFVVAAGAVDHEATGTLAVTGTAAEGGSLTASLTGVSDADGATTTAYQWQENLGGIWSDLSGANSDTLNIPSDQSYVGKTVRVVATTTDALGGTTAFEGTGQTIANVDDEATGTLAVTGTVAEGGSLTASLTGVSDADGTTTTAYQWQENLGGIWSDLSGANSDTLNIPSDQSYVGTTVRVVATTTDALGGTTAFEGTGQTIANVNDAPTGAVTIGGTATEGQILIASNTLADADGLGTIGYQWVADGINIGGATGSSYTLTGAEVGKAITLTASYTDLFGTPESVTSLATGIVTGLTGVTLTGTTHADTLNGGAGNDTLYGLAGNDTLNGRAGNDSLFGGSGNDSLAGGDGNDVLDGGIGSDKMAGGAGDDTYYVDSFGDTVTEAAGAGADTVVSSLFAYVLDNNVENLTLASGAYIGIGNNLDNKLVGNASGNILSGLAGNDTVTGSAGSDLLFGDDGNDVMDGGAGSDLLIGGAGNDTLSGGLGADTFRFDSALSASNNLDTILGFLSSDDTIQLENSIFTKLTKTGTLPNAQFHAGADGLAKDANDFIVYDTDSGALYYDADGNGAGAAIQFATLVGTPSITAADFFIV